MTDTYYYFNNNCFRELSMTSGDIKIFGKQKSFKCPFELVENQKVFVILNIKDKIIVNIMFDENEIDRHIDNYGVDYYINKIFSTNVCKDFTYR
jgi:hypothetical protein